MKIRFGILIACVLILSALSPVLADPKSTDCENPKYFPTNDSNGILTRSGNHTFHQILFIDNNSTWHIRSSAQPPSENFPWLAIELYNNRSWNGQIMFLNVKTYELRLAALFTDDQYWGVDRDRENNGRHYESIKDIKWFQKNGQWKLATTWVDSADGKDLNKVKTYTVPARSVVVSRALESFFACKELAQLLAMQQAFVAVQQRLTAIVAAQGSAKVRMVRRLCYGTSFSNIGESLLRLKDPVVKSLSIERGVVGLSFSFTIGNKGETEMLLAYAPTVGQFMVENTRYDSPESSERAATRRRGR